MGSASGSASGLTEKNPFKAVVEDLIAMTLKVGTSGPLGGDLLRIWESVGKADPSLASTASEVLLARAMETPFADHVDMFAEASTPNRFLKCLQRLTMVSTRLRPTDHVRGVVGQHLFRHSCNGPQGQWELVRELLLFCSFTDPPSWVTGCDCSGQHRLQLQSFSLASSSSAPSLGQTQLLVGLFQEERSLSMADTSRPFYLSVEPDHRT